MGCFSCGQGGSDLLTHLGHTWPGRCRHELNPANYNHINVMNKYIINEIVAGSTGKQVLLLTRAPETRNWSSGIFWMWLFFHTLHTERRNRSWLLGGWGKAEPQRDPTFADVHPDIRVPFPAGSVELGAGWKRRHSLGEL